MQVNNNVQSPNFGMALKIGKGGREYLAKQSEKTLENLQKIGEEMKDYKHWDLFVTEKGPEAVEKGKALPHRYASYVKIDSDNAINKYSNSSLQFDTFIGGHYANSGNGTSLRFDNLGSGEVQLVKNKFACNSNNMTGRFAEFVRFLERRSAEDAAAKATQEAKEAKINGLVDDLVSKFSVEA